MSSPPDSGATKLATRLAFLAAGFALACWAPLVPFAKARIGADDRQLGFVLLCLGIGSVVAMPLTGWLSARVGSKPVIVIGGFGVAVLLPLLSVAGTDGLLAATLLGFGAAIGTLDVAMNTHAVEVEKSAGKSLMSGFHAMFSVGGFAGAGSMTFMLSSGLSPWTAALVGGAVTAVAIGMAWPRLLPARGTPTSFVLPHGLVMLMAALAAITFLVEGAVLDWGALLMVESRTVEASHGGLGYMMFSISMTVCRLAGDRVVACIGNYRTLFWGGVVTMIGFAVLLTAPMTWLAMSGFLLVGLGASNIVPVLFRLAGNQTVMPPALAVAALTTMGYAGVLAGPAMIGFLSHAIGLPAAFWWLLVLMAFVPLFAGRVTRV